jgi:hypothetical protein
MKLSIAFALLLAACGGKSAQPPDAGPEPETPASTIEVVAGGRMTGGSLVVDVQIGHPHPGTPVTEEAP